MNIKTVKDERTIHAAAREMAAAVRKVGGDFLVDFIVRREFGGETLDNTLWVLSLGYKFANLPTMLSHEIMPIIRKYGIENWDQDERAWATMRELYLMPKNPDEVMFEGKYAAFGAEMGILGFNVNQIAILIGMAWAKPISNDTYLFETILNWARNGQSFEDIAQMIRRG